MFYIKVNLIMLQFFHWDVTPALSFPLYLKKKIPFKKSLIENKLWLAAQIRDSSLIPLNISPFPLPKIIEIQRERESKWFIQHTSISLNSSTSHLYFWISNCPSKISLSCFSNRWRKWNSKGKLNVADIALGNYQELYMETIAFL